MKTSKVKSILAYKVFNRRKVQDGYTKTPDKFILKGAHTHNTILQKVGDKASVPKNQILKICECGWHAITPRNLPDWTTTEDWKAGRKAVFLVKLSGDIVRDRNKMAGRHIEMLEEIPYNSKKGAQLRVIAAKQRAVQAERDRAKAKAFNRRRAAIRATRRLKEQARKLHISKVTRATRKLISKQNAVIRNLKTLHRAQYRALVKKLGGWR